MPASFWRPANFQNMTAGSPDNLLETIRLGAQVYYYGLLLQLHLPYMMYGTNDSARNEYSVITCVNAGRDIIIRFIAHRVFQPKASCSRPVDFFALLAAMTLSLTHLDAHRHPRHKTNFRAHQRLSDRALLEQALERMDAIRVENGDVVMGESARLIRQLLEIEADAAKGTNYTASSVGEAQAGVQESASKEGKDLLLPVPYLGTIRITRHDPISREPLPGGEASGSGQKDHFPFMGPTHSLPPASSTNPCQAFEHVQGMAHEFALSEELLSTGRPDWCGQTTSELQQPFAQSEGIVALDMLSTLDLSDSIAGIDEWSFQGVDAAFFDSPMRGFPDPPG